MREETSASGEAGIVRHVLALASTAMAYLRARLELAGIEGKEAGVHYVKLIAVVVAAGILAIFGYVLFCFGLVFLIAAAFGGGNAWIWVTFAFALLHFLAAAGGVIWALKGLKKPVFAATLEEFKKDQAWLHRTTEKPN